MERLRYYEEAEANNRLIVLPCTVGDNLWFFDILPPEDDWKIRRGSIRCEKVESVNIEWDEEFKCWSIIFHTHTLRLYSEDIGKYAFLTFEAAEEYAKAQPLEE